MSCSPRTARAVHEVLVQPGCRMARFALLLAVGNTGRHPAQDAAREHRAIVWCDASPIYPPAVAAAGIDVRKLYLVRPHPGRDEHWALAECLRCKAVAATLAAPRTLSHVEARRLQLAAEAGGGIGCSCARSIRVRPSMPRRRAGSSSRLPALHCPTMESALDSRSRRTRRDKSSPFPSRLSGVLP